MSLTNDFKTMIMGVAGWSIAVPAVKIAGQACVASNGNKAGAVVFGVGLAYITTPLLARIAGWKTPTEKVRGVALALALAAQMVDGLVHIFFPSFYTDHPPTGLACAGNIFWGAGLLGIFSAFQ